MAAPWAGPASKGAAGPLEGVIPQAVEPTHRDSLAGPAELLTRRQFEAVVGDEMGGREQHSTEEMDDDDADDDADDLDFNPLFLRDSEEEESEDEEAEDPPPAPTPLQALLDETLASQPPVPGSPPVLHSPVRRPPVLAVVPFSPGPSAFRLFGWPQTFSPETVRAPPTGTLPASAGDGAAAAAAAATVAERGEAVDGPAKRTRSQVSLAELTMEELETFLQDDEDDFFPGIDDDAEYERFLASISALDEVAGDGGESTGPGAEDEDDDDVDFVAEEEDAGEEEEEEEEEDGAQSLIRKRKSGRPRGSRVQKPPTADIRAAALRRPLAIKPSSLDARFRPMVCHAANSQDGHLRPMLMLHPIPPPPSLPRFTSHQVGQLYCQISEHVQLLLQLYCVTCLGAPPSRALAAQCRTYLEALASARECVLRDKQTAFPDRCFQPPCTRPSLHPAVLRDGQLTTAPWAPPLEGPVRSLLDVQPLRAVRDFLQNITLVIAEIDRKFPPSSGQTFPRTALKPLFPPHPDARPAQKPSQTIRSILTNQHNPAPLPHHIGAPSFLGEVRQGQPPLARQGPEAALGFHSLLLGETQAEAPPGQLPRSLFLKEGPNDALEVGPTRDATPPPPLLVPASNGTGGGTLVRSKASSSGGGIPEYLLKAAKPTLMAMALVAPIVSDLVQEMFREGFNPALYPREPAPTARPRAFSEAEDELLALGIQEFNTEWERIRERFLPTKTVHQIATRVKNRCSNQAPDNIVKQTRARKTAPLTAQEKFFVDEGILHHGYDWLHLAAYVPRADPALLPKLYREACGLKPKVWKASFARNERRKRQRQRAATERAQQEAAVELRDLATEEAAPRPTPQEDPATGTEADTPTEATDEPEGAASLSVRGLFLEEAAAAKAPQARQSACGAPPAPASIAGHAAATVRSWTQADARTQQPAAKRRKGTPGPLAQGAPIVSTSCAQRLMGTRPPLAPPATQALPIMGEQPFQPPSTAPAGSKARQAAPIRPVAMPPSASRMRPPLPSTSQPLYTNNHDSQGHRTIVVRPQARRATPISALQQPASALPVTAANGVHSRGTGPGRPAATSSQAAPSLLPVPSGLTGAAQRSHSTQPHAAAGSHYPNGAATDGPPSAPPGPHQNSTPTPTPSTTTGLPLPEQRQTPTQTQTVGTAQCPSRASLPEIPLAERQARSAPSAPPAAHQDPPPPPSAVAPPAPPPAPNSPKPWKTRQRQPKAVKAQQKAKEAEERRRKVEAKMEADKKHAAEKQASGPGVSPAAPSPSSAGESARVERRGPPQGRPPTVTVHTVRGRGGVTRITHIATGQRSQTHSVGPRPSALRAPGPLPFTGPAPVVIASMRPTAAAASGGRPPLTPAVLPGSSMRHPTPAPSYARPPQVGPSDGWAQQPIRPRAVHGVRARGPIMAPARAVSRHEALSWAAPGQSRHGQQSEAGPPSEGEAAERPGRGDGGGGGQAEHMDEETPVMETDELTDSEEEEEDRWQRDEMPDGDGDGRPATEAIEMEGGVRSAGREERLFAETEGSGEAEHDDAVAKSEDDNEGEAERAVSAHEMEHEELTDSEEEAGGEGGDGGRGMLRGFFLEQDELTESDDEEEEATGHGAQGLLGTAVRRLDGREAPTNAELLQKRLKAALEETLLGARGSTRGHAGEGRGVGDARRVMFEQDALEESDEDAEDGRGAGMGVDEDEMTESDEDLG